METEIAPGLTDKPRTNAYVAALIGHCSSPNKNRDGLSQTLLSLPDFITDDVWLLFEFEGTYDNSLANYDKYLTNAGESWQSVLIEFSRQEKLDRARLLNESLRALTRNFNQFRAGWFSRFHEALKPTDAEHFEQLDSYLRLLNSPTPSTVAFALDMIVSTGKVSPLKFEQLAAYLPNALTSKTKQNVLKAIKLLQKCAEREPSALKEICLVACSALVSENAEIQSLVIGLLSKYADQDDVQLRACLATYIPVLSASVAKKLPASLQCADHKLAEPVSLEVAVPTVSFAPPIRTLTPIRDLNELVLKALLVLENPEAYCEFELVLDGILRNCGRDQDDFAARTSSLLKRAHKLYVESPNMLTRSLCTLVIAWITGEKFMPTTRFFIGETSFRYIHGLRMESITERLRRRPSLPLLSLPTDEFGWIESSELRRRLSIGSAEYDLWDRCFALLRVRNPDAALIDMIVADSCHPVLAFARECAKERPIEWSLVRKADWRQAVFDMKPDPLEIFPGELVAGNSVVKAPELRWERPVSPEVLLMGALTPNLRQIYFAAGAQGLGAALHSSDVPDKAARHYFYFLQDPTITSGKMGSLLVVLGVSSGDQDISVAAIDTFITLVEQRRFDFESTADSMRMLFHHGDCIKANRWSKHFGTIAKASPDHSRVVYELLVRTLATPLESPPRDLHHILELLVELQAEHGARLPKETAASLASIKTGGKTKKLVDQLCR